MARPPNREIVSISTGNPTKELLLHIPALEGKSKITISLNMPAVNFVSSRKQLGTISIMMMMMMMMIELSL
jgi:hypothetical protein